MNNETKKDPKFQIFNAIGNMALLVIVVLVLSGYDDRLEKIDREVQTWEPLIDKLRDAAHGVASAVTNADEIAEFVRDYRQKKPQLDRIERAAADLRTQQITAAVQQHETLLITGKIIEWMKEVQARHDKEDQIDTNFLIVSPEGHRVWRKMVTDPDANRIPLFY